MDIEGQQYILKPMNCLYHILIYKTKLHSYRELPIRFAELGTVYRYERSGVLHGLSRVRGFTQDDAHIFCRYDQLQTEVEGVLDLAMFMIATFGFQITRSFFQRGLRNMLAHSRYGKWLLRHWPKLLMARGSPTG